MLDFYPTLSNVKFKNPILLASGTASFGLELMKLYDLSELGGIVLKTITLEERKGNEPPRIVETYGGVLNSIGLANPGLRRFKDEVLPKVLGNIKTNIIVSVAGSSVGEFREIVEEISSLDIAFIELNLSCPNVEKGGVTFDSNEENVREVVKVIKRVSKKPFWVKLSPNTSNIVKNALICEEEGADGITAINTILGMKIDVKTGKPVFKNIFAGYSGPAIKPIALRYVYEICKNVSIPVIGVGGISSYEDVLEFMYAGAKLIQIGTSNFFDPLLPKRVVERLYESKM
ncbi:MAG: dihydroorotate dehydrogenase [Brevinematales bacterium]|nr:dihydroorotate dehydrogenase [Brevinematales bacterium]